MGNQELRHIGDDTMGKYKKILTERDACMQTTKTSQLATTQLLKENADFETKNTQCNTDLAQCRVDLERSGNELKAKQKELAECLDELEEDEDDDDTEEKLAQAMELLQGSS